MQSESMCSPIEQVLEKTLDSQNSVKFLYGGMKMYYALKFSWSHCSQLKCNWTNCLHNFKKVTLKT